MARLELTDQEIESFAGQLGDILAFAQQVQAVDTGAIPPDSEHGISIAAATPTRTDTVERSLPRDEVLVVAPLADASSGLIKVPRVLKP